MKKIVCKKCRNPVSLKDECCKHCGSKFLQDFKDEFRKEKEKFKKIFLRFFPDQVLCEDECSVYLGEKPEKEKRIFWAPHSSLMPAWCSLDMTCGDRYAILKTFEKAGITTFLIPGYMCPGNIWSPECETTRVLTKGVR